MIGIVVFVLAFLSIETEAAVSCTVSAFAGVTSIAAGVYINGRATSSQFGKMFGVWVTTSGSDLMVPDYDNKKVRKISMTSPNMVTDFAGGSGPISTSPQPIGDGQQATSNSVG